MPVARDDPYGRFNFIVEIDGVDRAAFSEVEGLAGHTDVIAYREGADKSNAFRLLPGLVRYPPVLLRRGFAADARLFEWWQSVRDGVLDRRSVAIVLLDEKREPVTRWRLRRAWPTKWEGPSLDAKASDVAIETLELVHEGIELE
jgi:phage tail-like protein